MLPPAPRRNANEPGLRCSFDPLGRFDAVKPVIEDEPFLHFAVTSEATPRLTVHFLILVRRLVGITTYGVDRSNPSRAYATATRTYSRLDIPVGADFSTHSAARTAVVIGRERSRLTTDIVHSHLPATCR